MPLWRVALEGLEGLLDRPVALEGLEGLLEALPKSLDPILTKYIMDLFRKWAEFGSGLLRVKMTKNYTSK